MRVGRNHPTRSIRTRDGADSEKGRQGGTPAIPPETFAALRPQFNAIKVKVSSVVISGRRRHLRVQQKKLNYFAHAQSPHRKHASEQINSNGMGAVE